MNIWISFTHGYPNFFEFRNIVGIASHHLLRQAKRQSGLDGMADLVYNIHIEHIFFGAGVYWAGFKPHNLPCTSFFKLIYQCHSFRQRFATEYFGVGVGHQSKMACARKLEGQSMEKRRKTVPKRVWLINQSPAPNLTPSEIRV